MQYSAKYGLPTKWYDRDHWPYQKDRMVVTETAHWVGDVDWQVFGTFSFAAWKISDEKAENTFATFIDQLERSVGADVAYIRGDEKTLMSGRHFHTVMTSAATLHPAYVEFLWKELAGNNADNPSAKVEPYNPALGGVKYALKAIHKPDGGWAVRKLELFHPESMSLHDMDKRFRRRLRRHKARQKKFNAM